MGEQTHGAIEVGRMDQSRGKEEVIARNFLLPAGLDGGPGGGVGAGAKQGEFLSLLTLTAGGANDPVRLEELQKFLPKEGE
jgi:hypothetical protein